MALERELATPNGEGHGGKFLHARAIQHGGATKVNEAAGGLNVLGGGAAAGERADVGVGKGGDGQLS
jgi:hypothetical protein